MTASIKLLTILVLLSSVFIISIEADCWNYMTGSRCDNEAFWKEFGFKTCNDKCKSEKFKSGKCVDNTETCPPLPPKIVKVCKCSK